MFNFRNFNVLKRKKRRGVTRTIDFTVAFSLFIIIYVQFLLVIINVNFLINTGKEEGNPAKELAERLLSKPGFNSAGMGTDWAFSTGSPDELGLLSTESTFYKTFIDLNKLSRLNPDLEAFQNNGILAYDQVSLDSRSDLGLSEGYDNVRITTSAFYNVTVSSTITPGPNTISSIAISVNSNNQNNRLSNIDVVFSVYDLLSQSFLAEGSSTTNSLGSATFSTTILEPTNPYLILSYAESSILTNAEESPSLWGIGWTAYSTGGSIQLGEISSYVTENSTHINHSVFSQGITNIFSQTFFPSRDLSSPTTNLTIISGDLTSNTSDSTFVSSSFNSGTKPMFMLGFYNTGGNQFRYQVSSLPLLFQGKEDSLISQTPSFDSIETSSFSQWESEGRFSNHFSYEQIVYSRRGPFILRIEVASL